MREHDETSREVKERLSINEHRGASTYKGVFNVYIRRLMKIWFPCRLHSNVDCAYKEPSSSASHRSHKEWIFVYFLKAPSHGDERKSHINFARSINSTFPLCSFEHGNYDEENWDWEYMLAKWIESTVKEVH